MQHVTAAMCLALLAGPLAPQPTTSAEVVIRDEAGAVFGVLRLSHDGKRLMLDSQGHQAALGECADKPLQERAGPSGKLRAIVYERNCGATVDFATHVALESNGVDALVAVYAGRLQIELAWVDGALEIGRPPVSSDRVFRETRRSHQVAISYRVAGAASPPTAAERLDFANVNYGATGRAAGLPAELLLRMAGWAQEASGMSRAEWGGWTGRRPYGDDPRGTSKIEEGIRYYETKYRK